MARKVLFIFLIYLNTTFSQSHEKEISNEYIIKLSALDLLTGFQFESSTLQLGIEKSISKYLSINSELGYIFYIGGKPGILGVDLDNSSGVTFETELRKYIDKEGINSDGQYLSVDFLYRYFDGQKNHTVLESPFEGANLSEWIYKSEEYSTFRNECALHLKYGYQNISASGFVSDFSIGVGWRYITSKTNNTYQISLIEYEFPYSKPFIKGSKSFFSVTAAIRFGWSIK